MEISKLFISFIISASPLGELKIGLPYALHQHLNDYAALIFCIAGNLLVYPIINFLMENYGHLIFRNNKVKRKMVTVRQNTQKRTKDLIEKYGFWGLMVFVAVPLPGTGAYFGTIAAYVFNIESGKAMKAISIGVIVTGILYYLAMKGLIKGLEFIL
jgi:uncharacterized membrane protein